VFFSHSEHSQNLHFTFLLVPLSIETTYCHVEDNAKDCVKKELREEKKMKTELWVMVETRKTGLGEGRE